MNAFIRQKEPGMKRICRIVTKALKPRSYKTHTNMSGDAECAGRGSGSIHQRPRPSDCRHDRGVTIDSFPSSAPQRRHPARQCGFRHRNFSPSAKLENIFYLWTCLSFGLSVCV